MEDAQVSGGGAGCGSQQRTRRPLTATGLSWSAGFPFFFNRRVLVFGPAFSHANTTEANTTHD
jgi:hypothetical protein